ncbi:Mevalonate kinase [Streptococcus pneumoniae]|nr:Mevalonate kinase [Streptococcus pneumoniae]
MPLLEVEVTCKVVPAESPWRLYEEDTLSMAVYASLEYLDITEACVRCEIDSAIPEKRGMGSSAAISIAAIRAVFDYYQADLPHDVLEILVNRAEMIAHMNPSGLDAKTCLSDQPIRFIKNVGFTELEMDLSAYLVIADTGVYGHTREAIQVVQNKGKDALPFLHALGELTQQAEVAISQKDAEGLGQILSQAHLHLKEIGVSSPEADFLVETTLSHGALGAKMSGGGLGGCIIALVTNLTHAQELAERLEEKGAVQTWIESL